MRYEHARYLVGLLVVALGVSGFGWLADAAVEGDRLAALDPGLTTDLVAHRTADLTKVAEGISFVGDVPILLLLTALVATGVWIRTSRWQPALLLAALVWSADVRRAAKLVALATAVVLSLAMGLSRIYLGYHWATDVLAGWLVALTWLCLIATAQPLLRQAASRYGQDRRL
jgi:membrane-associated phospholipid phosphatase